MSGPARWYVASRPVGPGRTTYMLIDKANREGVQRAVFDDWALAEAVAVLLNDTGSAALNDLLRSIAGEEPF